MNKFLSFIASSMALYASMHNAGASASSFRLETTGTFAPTMRGGAVHIRQGGHANVPVEIVSEGGFSGTVTVELARKTPPGITMLPLDVVVGANQTAQGTLKLRIAPGVTSRTHTIDLLYSYGRQHQERTLTVVVTDEVMVSAVWRTAAPAADGQPIAHAPAAGS